MDSYRRTINARLDYYRQLQILSDQVRQVDQDEGTEGFDQGNLTRLASKIDKVLQDISSLKALARYLEFLKTDESRNDKICPICRKYIKRPIAYAVRLNDHMGYRG